MAYSDSDSNYSIFLSPSLRGAEDFLRDPLQEVLESARLVYLCSQQVSDKKVVNGLAALRAEKRGRARVLIEADYLYERSPLPSDSIWDMGGKREKNRQCLLALQRAGIEVRADQIKGALQHTNMVLAETETGVKSTLLTSANLSKGSLTTHFNWAIRLGNEELFKAGKSLFSKSWDGDFRDASTTLEVSLANEKISLSGGANGQAAKLAESTIDQAQDSISFAYFNLSSGSRVYKALIRAKERGVKVYGLVDGDQVGTSWDGVPGLREAGLDARYYPGVLTGALGRMHYKMFVVDGVYTHLSTANGSMAAENSFELGMTIANDNTPNSTAYLKAEIDRLLLNATIPQDNR